MLGHLLLMPRLGHAQHLLVAISVVIILTPEISSAFALGSAKNLEWATSNRLRQNKKSAAVLLGLASQPDVEPITDCMETVSVPGRYSVESPGSGGVCGVYISSNPDDLVEVEFEFVDVTCEDGGLIAFFDGWEMNGKVFPSADDHELSISERSAEFCNDLNSRKTKKITRRFIASQNAAMIQYRIPKSGQGFVVNLNFRPHPKPCHVLVSALSGLFMLSNHGERRNCSLTSILMPATTFQILEMEVGMDKGQEKCCVGGGDFVEIGGAQGFESKHLMTTETLCGCNSKSARNKHFTVFCQSGIVRLISSGATNNQLAVVARPTEDKDLADLDKGILLMCPDVM